ncbi:MAG TPA: GNAT family N-acetyltransferase [Polyangia bacterium]|nr:GNAT family N-acetyltransferase [Polyangia bacterium]
MVTVIKTSRLLLRPFQLMDAEVAHAWFGDPLVMRYTPTGSDDSVEKTRERLAEYQAHQAAHGFSKWLIADRESGRALGDAGLLRLPDEGWMDLGFRLLPSYWGKGLATEAASAWVSAAAGVLHLRRLGAFVHPENVASIHVLEKVGFRTERQDTVMGMHSIVFGLDLGDAS